MRTRTLRRFLCAAGLVAAATSTTALGGDPTNQLQIDINAFTCSVDEGTFGTTYTGSITMADDDDSELAGVLIDGVNQGITGVLMSFDGQVEFNNGDVIGGWFDVVVMEADTSMNTYSATIMSGEGQINPQAGQGFSIDGLTYMGTFTSSTFAGVDILDWTEDQPLLGSFLKFQFNPTGAANQDVDTDIDIFVDEMNVPDEECPCLENEFNDTFENRDFVNCDCTYLTGKLEKRGYPGRFPDTYLFLFDKQDNVICEDDNSSTKGNGKASACFGVAPVLNNPSNPSEGATVRLGITGRPDGIDNHFNGLFFNAPHEQLGQVDVCVTYYDDGVEIGTDTYWLKFKTGAEAFRVNFEVPEGTTSVDVELDNAKEEIEYSGDVDYYQFDCFPPSCDVRIRVVGAIDYDCEVPPLALGWFNKDGMLVDCSTETDELDCFPFIDVISDSNGRVRLAVSGANDCDFDGLADGAMQVRDVGTPGVELPPFHGVSGMYVLCWEVIEHHAPGEPNGPDPQAMTMLEHGDLNMDGGTDVIDLAILLNNWGWTAP